MRLNYLEIQGFKSFPDKTKITFNQGLTAVVGPNGSGKSNISDAIRWVMGEQSNKNLRGANMEDVIFTGTKTRKSQGFAEVSLAIDNTDRTLPVEHDEVLITRRYSRSGDSDYMINRANVRLKDINELFMDTGLGKDGYAMVGQGKIAEIVQSKSDERRVIFEEAAGISKFRSRKNEAQKKLNSAEDNLVRLRDILQELEERVGPLKHQSEKAKKFIELSEQRKTAEISSWMYTLDQSNASLKDQSDRILARQLEHDEVEAQVESIEQQIQTVYMQMQQCLVDIDELRHRKEELEQSVAEKNSAIAVCENDILHNTQNKERVEEEISRFQDSGQLFEQEIKQREEEFIQLEEKLREVEIAITEKERALLELVEKSDEFSDSQSVLNQKMNELIVHQSEYRMSLMQGETQKEEEQRRHQNNTLGYEQKKKNLEQIHSELNHATELATELEEQALSLENTKKGYQLKLQSKQESYDQLQSEYNKVDLLMKEKRQRAKLLQDLEKNMEGFAYSVKHVLNRGKSGALNGVLGTVSQLLTVPEDYSTAIETALGGSLQHIVMESDRDAKNAIQLLKRDNSGRATFLPLNAVRGTKLNVTGLEKAEGFIAIASDLVQFDSRYDGIVNSLLGRIVITEDLDCATQIAKQNGYKFRLVTLDGQVVNAGGSMSGGSKNKSQNFLSRKTDIAKLLDEAQTAEQKSAEIRKTATELVEEISALRAQETAINSESITINEDRIRCEGEQKRLSITLEQETIVLKSMERELSEHQEKITQIEENAKNFSEKLKETEQALTDLQSRLDMVQGENDEYLDTRNRLNEELSSLRLQKLELSKDMESVKTAIADFTARGGESAQQLVLLRAQVSEYETKNKEISLQIEKLKQDMTIAKESTQGMDEQVTQKMNTRRDLEAKSTSLRQDEKTLSVQKERIGQELARFEERKLNIQKEYDVIINKLWEEYQLTRSEAQAFAQAVEDIAELNKRLGAIKSQIKALGNVNVAAIEEYAEVSQRYEFLSAQLKDVESSRNELLHLIQDLTQKMQEIFLENFMLINQHFKRIFVELFGGGRAELKLTDEEDLLNCGIEIFVEPPGKIIKSLTLLSGGEQAFIAIAIYFSILNVRPAPFCVLDEIEAALDDVNVSKYAQYLRRMSDNTQFIMITHRRGTMEEADDLYGVTMQEDGISKLLQLKVSEIEHQLGKLD